jgi:hypothetical protein
MENRTYHLLAQTARNIRDEPYTHTAEPVDELADAIFDAMDMDDFVAEAMLLAKDSGEILGSEPEAGYYAANHSRAAVEELTLGVPSEVVSEAAKRVSAQCKKDADRARQRSLEQQRMEQATRDRGLEPY